MATFKEIHIHSFIENKLAAAETSGNEREREIEGKKEDALYEYAGVSQSEYTTQKGGENKSQKQLEIGEPAAGCRSQIAVRRREERRERTEAEGRGRRVLAL